VQSAGGEWALKFSAISPMFLEGKLIKIADKIKITSDLAADSLEPLVLLN